MGKSLRNVFVLACASVIAFTDAAEAADIPKAPGGVGSYKGALAASG
jgi:hypothetical protein